MAVCGGIACYKAAEVVSKLVQAGVGVTVAMSREARRFVTPLTFEALSGRAVRTDAFRLVDPGDAQHIGLTEQADLMLVAPATANILAKAAHGICDDLVSLLIAASACPVMFAPSMNHRMWENPATVENLRVLQSRGYAFTGPESGWLACRNVGMGRMSEPQTIVDAALERIATRRRTKPATV